MQGSTDPQGGREELLLNDKKVGRIRKKEVKSGLQSIKKGVLLFGEAPFFGVNSEGTRKGQLFRRFSSTKE